MKYLSVCSGIEAATCAWHPLGWTPVGFSEIEKFPRAVLAHHHPDVPNFGDMTRFQEWPDDLEPNLLVGGTPCQSFSVAGLRKGLDDPRGNLMLTFGSIARRYRPEWLVWENVPGVLSSNGGDDFKAFLDMLESLGYVCDVEILDAQFFGVPQRRRRVFVCAQHRDDLLSQKTDTSALTIAQCLQEILLCILSEARSRFGSEQGSSDLPSRSKDGAKRRMELFGLVGESDCWPMLLENLVAAFRRLPQEQKPLGATHGEPGKEPTLGVQSMDSQTESLFTLTEQSLKNALDDALEVMRLFITSTATSSTTQAQIFLCSRAALLIAKLTQRLSQSSPAFWSSALSSLTAVEEFTDYARSTSGDLFGDLERIHSWSDFIEQAEHSNDTFLGFGVECFGEIFPLPDCLSWHPAPRREAGQVAPTIPSRSTGGGGLGTDFDCDGGLIRNWTAQVACPLNASFGDKQGLENQHAPSGASLFVPATAHTMRGEGFDASEDGTGRGTPLVPVHCREVAGTVTSNYGKQVDSSDTALGPNIVAFSCKDHGADAGEISPTLRSMNHDGSHANGGGQVAVAFNWQGGGTQTSLGYDPEAGVTGSLHVGQTPAVALAIRGRDGGATAEVGDDCAFSLRASTGGGDKPHVMAGMAVRRLTPRECERLQGFPEVQKCYTILVCRDLSDQQKANALAALQCRKSPSNAWLADASGWTLSAEAAAHHSSTSHQHPAPPVVVDVLIDLERQVVRLHSAGKSFSPASNAGEKSEFPLPTGIESIARLAALLTHAWALTITDGRAGSQANIKPSSPQLSGSGIAISYGHETGEPASDVANAIETANRLSTSITLPSGLDTETLRSTLTTLSCCVVRAIAGCIPETTRTANCYAVRLTTSQGYTAIPWRGKPASECPDGPRYKALGNSFAVPVVRWIGERIAQVSAMEVKREAA